MFVSSTMYLEGDLETLHKQQKLGKLFLHNFNSSRDAWTWKVHETMKRWKNTRRLSAVYFSRMSTVVLLHSSVLFLYFLQVHPYLKWSFAKKSFLVAKEVYNRKEIAYEYEVLWINIHQVCASGIAYLELSCGFLQSQCIRTFLYCFPSCSACAKPITVSADS